MGMASGNQDIDITDSVHGPLFDTILLQSQCNKKHFVFNILCIGKFYI